MENLVFLAPYIPFLAMLPPSIAAVWIANRWLKTRATSNQLQSEIKTLREEVDALRQAGRSTPVASKLGALEAQ